MLMPMLWTNDFDDLYDMMNSWYDPFDDVVVDLQPTKDDIETAKSIERHEKKEDKKYNKALRHTFNQMNHMMTRNAMKTDVVDNGDHFTVKADLPGFKKEDIKVSLDDGILTVSASHQENNDEKDKKDGRYLRRERSYASYQRSFSVGDDVTPEEIKAKYENGVLTLNVPNKAPAIEQKEEAKQIEIQ